MMNVFVLTEVVDVDTNFVTGIYGSIDGAKSTVMLLANGPLRWVWDSDDGAHAAATVEDDSSWEINKWEVQ